MDDTIAWAVFLGAWLLVAGPLYQGSTELTEMDLDREAIAGARASLTQTGRRPSVWWWLLPPVMYVLRRRWNRKFRHATYAHLRPDQREQVTSFRHKAAGWYTVAIGAFLLAAGETWSITEHYRWPVWLFWVLIVVMLAASVLNTTVRMVLAQREDQRTSLAAAS